MAAPWLADLIVGPYDPRLDRVYNKLDKKQMLEAASDAPILISRDGAIATVTFNNPEKRNAFNKPMWAALRDAMDALSADDDLRCVILRGAGDEAFAAGADISEFETERANPGQALAYDQLLNQALTAIYDCRHPTVAMIHGACMGGGLQIAIQCDIRISGESGKFGAPIKVLGLAMPSAEIESIMRVTGPAAMMEILLEGKVLAAEEAYTKGIVSRIVPDEGLEAEAQATAKRIAQGAPLTARWHKQFIHNRLAMSNLTNEEVKGGYFYFDTDDFKEGVDAFLNKRRPAFKGK
jgi:enoyl-CoA hydratase